MKIQVLDLFHHDFAFSPIDEIPAGGLPVWYFPEASRDGGRNGVLVDIVGASGEWIGMFAFGNVSPSGVSGIYSCPDKTRLLVVSRGQGFYVSADKVRSELVPLDPVMDVCAAPDAGLLIMHDFTRFVAYGDSGMAWETPCLSWDGISSVEVDGVVLRGAGWDEPTGKNADFEIQLATGSFSGGSSPELLAK